jgi:hypothetical protein
MAKEVSSPKFTPSPGILLVDPIEKTRKSDMMAVADTMDDPRSGFCVAAGDDRPYDSNPKIKQKSPAKVGDFILYSIQGCEETKLPYKGNPRHRFIIVPFNRVLLIRGDGEYYRDK